MKNLAVVAMALGGLYLMARTRPVVSPPLPPRPPTEREYHDRLANRLEFALSLGNKPMWDELSGECRRAGRGDLPERAREKWPDWAERLDRA